MVDLIIRNGRLIDGTGRPAFLGDLAVTDGRIVEVSPAGELSAARPSVRSTPTGLLVTPGWVDIHTHYDGQATWDDVLAPSAGTA